VPGVQPLGSYQLTLHNLAPELKRRPAGDPAGFLAGRAGEPHAALEVAAATGRTTNDTLAALDRLATRGLVHRIAVGGEDQLWCFGAPAVELRCRQAPARPEPIERQFGA
jgi:hypothetical protein